MRRSVRTLGLVAAVLAGCGLNTTSRDGKVGDELKAGVLEATVIKVKRRVHTPSHDITGLSTPQPGKKFVGVRVNVCNSSGPFIKTYDFKLERSGGDAVHAHYAQQVYENSFEGLREGCDDGWMVFEIPKDSRPKAVTFRYDDTGGGGPSGRNEKHARFRWDLR